MKWTDLAETVGEYAPAAGAMLAGGQGAAVGGLIARALGVDQNPEAVSTALTNDPDAAIKLRGIEADLEAVRIEARAEAVTAEAKSESVLARNWRPISMLLFVVLIAAHWLGLTDESISDAVVLELLDVVQVGLGGYVIGRSAEKVVREGTGKGLLDRIKTK